MEAVSVDVSGPSGVPVKEPKPWHFKRGNVNGVDPGPISEPESMEPATLLDDMLHVRNRAARFDRTTGQKDVRKWKNKDIKGFMTKLSELEEAAKSESKPKELVSGIDFASDRLRELIPAVFAEALAREPIPIPGV